MLPLPIRQININIISIIALTIIIISLNSQFTGKSIMITSKIRIKGKIKTDRWELCHTH